MNFSKYYIRNDHFVVETVFVPGQLLPDGIPISTPFTVPFLGDKVVLALDKSTWWNFLGGHIEAHEEWLDCLMRESFEEAGVEIEDIALIGYIKATRISGESKYPAVTLLPVTTSKVAHYIHEWKSMETLDRGVFEKVEALRLLAQRNDNHQLFEILTFIIS